MKKIKIYREYLDASTTWAEQEFDFEDNHVSTVTAWRWWLWVRIDRVVNRVMNRLEKLLLDPRPIE